MIIKNDNPAIRQRSAAMVKAHLGELVCLYAVYALLSLATVGIFTGIVFLVEVGISSAFLTFVVGAIGLIASLMLINVFSYGLLKARIAIYNNQHPGLGMLFSCFNRIVGCLGLSLWVPIRIILYFLPGAAVAVVGLFIAMSTAVPGWCIPLGILLSVAGYLAAVAMTVLALFRFSMSFCIFAENSAGFSVMEAVDSSRRIMIGRKFQYFRLLLPYWLIDTAICLVCLLLSWLTAGSATFSAVPYLCSILAAVASLYVGFHCTLASCGFYLNHCE